MKLTESMKFKLWAGHPIEVVGVGELHPLTLNEIISMGYEIYQKYIGILLVEENMLKTKDEPTKLSLQKQNGIGVQESTISILAEMCESNEEMCSFVLTALELVFKKQFTFLNINGIVFAESGKISNALTEENYEDFKNVLKAQYCISSPKEEEYRPANNAAREMIERIKKNKANAPQPKQTISLLSMVSAISWKGASGDVSSVLKLTMYQIHDAYYRLMTIDNFQNTMFGIYTGNVDAKKVKMKDLDWAKIIEVVQ